MNNTVLVESKARQKLKLFCTLMCVFCLCAIAVLVSIYLIGNKTLNGQTVQVEGILNEIYTDDSNTVTLDENKQYNVVWDKEKIDLHRYKGSKITLIVSADTFASNPWAFGLTVDGETIVDFNETLADKTAENNETKTVIIIVTAILCVITCGLFIWRFNVQPTAEHELSREFGEFVSMRQPTCPKRKFVLIYTLSYIVILFALLIVAIVLDPETETISELSTASKAVLWAMLAFGILGAIGLFVMLLFWLGKEEINFYDKNFPFDFSDISHIQMRKKAKEELQQQILKEYAEHPDTFADGGNGYDVTFDEKGVTLTLQMPLWDENEESAFPQQTEMPSADAVFGKNSVTDINGKTEINFNKTIMSFTYEQLNFEALAHFRKNIHPMTVIIKSRLNRTDDFPEEFVNDIHIALDINLLNTLKKFNIKVENLDYLLQNKKQLMLENCLTFSKNKGKNTK